LITHPLVVFHAPADAGPQAVPRPVPRSGLEPPGVLGGVRRTQEKLDATSDAAIPTVLAVVILVASALIVSASEALLAGR
jgi:hypothetical protein